MRVGYAHALAVLVSASPCCRNRRERERRHPILGNHRVGATARSIRNSDNAPWGTDCWQCGKMASWQRPLYIPLRSTPTREVRLSRGEILR
jgi:hypothetical protein